MNLKMIKKNKVNTTLYNALYINPLDTEALKDVMNYKKVIIYDPYGTDKGFAELVGSYLINHAYKGEVITKAVPNVFVKQGTISEQRQRYNLLVKDIIAL